MIDDELRKKNKEEEKIINNKYKLIKIIGKGSFAKVYLSHLLTNKEDLYAIKLIPKKKLENQYLYDALFREIRIMEICVCENSVKLYDFFEDEINYYLIMELCDTDLDTILYKKKRGFNEMEIFLILKQFNNILIKMHENNIIHRDLKLKNILIKKNNSSNILKFDIKLSDFGFSTILKDDVTHTKLGTPATMAPEILMSKEYNYKADFWSLGVIIYQLYFKTIPFKGKNDREILYNIQKNVKPNLPNLFHVSNDKKEYFEKLWDLINKLLVLDQNKRINFEDYINHDFFKLNFDNYLYNKEENENEILIDKIIKFYDKEEENKNDNKIDNKNNNNNKKEKFLLFEKYTFIKTFFDYDNKYKMYVSVENENTNNKVFIKQFNKKEINKNILNKSIFQKELNLTKLLKENNFLNFINFYENENNFYFVQEYFENSILLDKFIINNKDKLTDNFIINFINSLIQSFDFINENEIIFEYLSTKNFLINFKNENNFTIKFIDYGISKLFLEKNEIFLNNELIPSQKTNILNFGTILYKLITGKNFMINNEKDFIILPKKINSSLKNFIENCINLDINKRFNYDKIINYKFNTEIEIIDNNQQYFIKNLNNVLDCLIFKYENYINYIKENNDEFETYFKENNFIINNFINEIENLKIILNNINMKIKNNNIINLTTLNILKNNEIDFSSFNIKLENYYNEIISSENIIFDNYLKNLDYFLNILKIKYKEEYLNSILFNELENYFFYLFDKSILFYNLKNYEKSNFILNICKIIIEKIIILNINKFKNKKSKVINEQLLYEKKLNVIKDNNNILYIFSIFNKKNNINFDISFNKFYIYIKKYFNILRFIKNNNIQNINKIN